MENDENPDFEQEENNEEVDTTTEEVVDTEESTEDELAKARAEANKWRRLAEKSQKPSAKDVPHINNPSVDPDELRLIARGLTDEEIDKARVIAKGTGVSLTEALKDDMFISYQENLKEKARKEKAKLGASKGSGESEPDKGFRPGLTREEHMALWKETQT